MFMSRRMQKSNVTSKSQIWEKFLYEGQKNLILMEKSKVSTGVATGQKAGDLVKL